MKKTKLIAAIASLGIAIIAVVFVAADHIDAPAVTGQTTDITDFYAFQGENPDNLVFVANVQGLLTPGDATTTASFDENVLLEFNIDSNNDLVEDIVIQAIKRNDSMYFFGPVAPSSTGLNSVIETSSANQGQVKISTTTDVQTGTSGDIQYFAGPREDPFFFDFDQYNAVLANPMGDGFNDPGTDTFAGTNVLSVVVEVPKSLLGDGTAGVNPFAMDTPIYNVWVESKRKQ
ncbi:MAG: molecular chaperone DnaK [Flavobacteriaceae bacterium]|nr:molecular chaperone DnaK [Flavobacteriaceae bacterium]|tara:strand:- start:8933 stop:9628 length:696 start_codon:yes stop_codon:yes gene_type:complete